MFKIVTPKRKNPFITTQLPLPKHPNVIIYILCYNEETLKQAKNYPFYWAKPVLIKKQSILFENEFYPQLLELKDEWIDCEMVGTLSYKADKKININDVNDSIINRKYKQYHHFYKSKKKLRTENNPQHIHMDKIINTILDKWKINDPPCSYCNYWMCTPKLMIQFILWQTHYAIPYVKTIPRCYDNANYESNTSLSKEKLIQLWDKPYYPYLPFILERINPLFFNSSSEISLLHLSKS
jgi:hypothetical protein